VRCQTKGMVYTSGNTKMVDSGIVSVQGRAALRARWNLNTSRRPWCRDLSYAISKYVVSSASTWLTYLRVSVQAVQNVQVRRFQPTDLIAIALDGLRCADTAKKGPSSKLTT